MLLNCRDQAEKVRTFLSDPRKQDLYTILSLMFTLARQQRHIADHAATKGATIGARDLEAVKELQQLSSIT
jgi:hypothetical protein